MVINRGPGTAVGAALLLLLVLSPTAARADSVSCSTHSQRVTDAWETFNHNPNELEAQLGVVDALIDQGCYKEALPVLEAGLTQRPRSSELQSRKRAVNSMLSEQRFFEGLGTAQETAKLQHALMRCTKAFDLSACDDALRSKPDDPDLMVAKGDALAHAGKPAEAIAIYQRAGGLIPGNESLETKLADAEKQRETLVSQCQGGADAAAADACQAALIPGSPEEFSLLRRRGIVLQSIDQPRQALDAFIAANVLVHNDQSVALAIVALTDSTGRKDAVALAARGTSLLALGRPAEAVQALHQAETLAPALPGIRSEVGQAEQAAHQAAKHPPRTTVASATGSPVTSGLNAGGAGTASTSGPTADAAGAASASAPAASAAPGAVRSAAGTTARIANAAPGTKLNTAAAATTYSNDATAGRTN